MPVAPVPLTGTIWKVAFWLAQSVPFTVTKAVPVAPPEPVTTPFWLPNAAAVIKLPVALLIGTVRLLVAPAACVQVELVVSRFGAAVLLPVSVMLSGPALNVVAAVSVWAFVLLERPRICNVPPAKSPRWPTSRYSIGWPGSPPECPR